jgi:hypothetical protein
MKNMTHKFGLIVCKSENQDSLKDLVNETLKELNIHLKKGGFGHIAPIGKSIKQDYPKRKYCLFQIRVNTFPSYKIFDNFLIKLAEKLNDLDKDGLVLGHNDNDGFFWTDYYFEK